MYATQTTAACRAATTKNRYSTIQMQGLTEWVLQALHHLFWR